jgi:lipoprotein-anchoring transpeptidase ErfK/SrfK
LTLALGLLAAPGAEAQDDSFDQMIEGILQQHPNGAAEPQQVVPAPAEPAPPPTVPPAAETGEPRFAPSATGPRPYTPPKLAPKQPPAGQAGAAAPDASGNLPPGANPDTPARTQASLTPEAVNSATFADVMPAGKGADPLILKVQVLLDRAGASPGVIDAVPGGNLQKAIAAVETVLGLPADGVLDRQVWDALGGDNAPPILVQYQITPEDMAYQYLPAIPDDYAEQAKLPNLNYTSPQEMLAERFHMDIKLLNALNPNADFHQAGTAIWVTDVQGAPITTKIAHIVADKLAKQVRAYDAANRLIVAYPATIGSEETPSPSGDHRVNAVAPNPVYYYDPVNFVQGGNMQKLQLPPGPNNPVGSVWIDLTEPGYGIHGTPDPSKIGKTASHGCVRLTNWDAEELAGLVEPGIVVSFIN